MNSQLAVAGLFVGLLAGATGIASMRIGSWMRSTLALDSLWPIPGRLHLAQFTLFAMWFDMEVE